MRILHIWDQAGVSCVLAKYQRRLGHEVFVFKKHGFAPFGILPYYGDKAITLKKTKYALKCLFIPEKYDIIHIHDLWQLVPVVRALWGDKKKIILHYHGTILRRTPKMTRMVAERIADKVLVSTKDLLQYGNFTYLPNPVDTELFYKPSQITMNNTASVTIKGEMTVAAVEDVLTKHHVDVKLDPTAWKAQKVPYGRMPENLVRNQYFIDLFLYKGEVQDAHTLTGLQAMALGIGTFCSDYKIHYALPHEHYPENVVNQLERIYDSPLKVKI